LLQGAGKFTWIGGLVAGFLVSGIGWAESQAQNRRSNGLIQVMSVDYCADQYVLALADPLQIAALSPEAEDSHSFHRALAGDFPKRTPTAENILTTKPDVIFRNWGGSPRTIALAERMGIKVVTAEYGTDPETMFRNFQTFADAMGRQAAGKFLIAVTKEKLAEIKARPPLGKTAAYLAPGGITAGAGTFVDDVILEAGFQSHAAQFDLQGWRPLPLERFVDNPPDVIIASFFDHRSATASNWNIARHSRVKKLLAKTPTIYVPSRYLACSGLFLAETIELIRTEAEKIDSPSPLVESGDHNG
jgi:iron complex transport system substrate-binding protein